MNRMRFWVVEMLDVQGNPYTPRRLWSYYPEQVTRYTTRALARVYKRRLLEEHPKLCFRVVELVLKDVQAGDVVKDRYGEVRVVEHVCSDGRVLLRGLLNARAIADIERILYRPPLMAGMVVQYETELSWPVVYPGEGIPKARRPCYRVLWCPESVLTRIESDWEEKNK